MTNLIRSYKDLLVWQKAVELALQIYKVTKTFPTEERFGLANQMRRAAVSIAANIAEGRHRGSRKEFSHFVRIAFGSGTELETHMLIAKKLAYIRTSQSIDGLLEEVMKMLNVMLQKLEASS